MDTKNSFLEEFAVFWIHLLGQIFNCWAWLEWSRLFPITDMKDSWNFTGCQRSYSLIFCFFRWLKTLWPVSRFFLFFHRSLLEMPPAFGDKIRATGFTKALKIQAGIICPGIYTILHINSFKTFPLASPAAPVISKSHTYIFFIREMRAASEQKVKLLAWLISSVH